MWRFKKAQARSDWKYNLMATVMKAYSFQVLVDLYDKVPYSEAFLGAANLQPKFENGDVVYNGLLAEIDAALAKDYMGGTALTTAQKNTDFLFAGDMNLWKQFANTLKLKMYLRMINANPAAAQAGINKLFQDNAVFLSVGVGIKTWGGTPNNSNPFYEFNIRRLNTSTNIRASVTFVSWLTEKNDPRIVNYFGSDPVIPMNQGDFAATNAQQPTYGDATVFVQSPKDPVWFITKAESYFMQAEALERYAGGSGAEAAYNNGLQAAFDQAGKTLSGDLATTYAYPAAGSLENKIEAIITQKWASFPGTHDIEAYFEQQRTGYPKFSPVYSTNPAYIPGQLVIITPNSVTAGLPPRRLVLPAAVTDRNSNAPAAVPITTKVWWAK
ncbi:SusD/RagB family nutrient-binding outer membrane lipoprotein [Pedobacter sp. NJ-S-72]